MHFLHVGSAFPQMHRENASTDKKPSLNWKKVNPWFDMCQKTWFENKSEMSVFNVNPSCALMKLCFVCKVRSSAHLNPDPGVEPWFGQLPFSGLISQRSLASAMCFFSPWANKMLHASLSTDPTNTNVQMDAQIRAKTHTHTLVHMSGVRSGILTFRRVNAHVYHVEDLHFCAVRTQIHTQLSPKRLITHKTRRNASVPTHYSFKSGPLPFIDSNLRIVLEFWHLLILNLLTPGGPELNITPQYISECLQRKHSKDTLNSGYSCS